MIGLDTTVIVRYLMQDDPKQARKAVAVIESLPEHEPAFLSVVTIVEIIRVLESSFELDREQIALAIGGLLEARDLIVDRAPSVAQAVRAYRRGKADLDNALIERISNDAGCEARLTSDPRAACDAGMRLIV